MTSDRTPPRIVEDADDPAEALIRFIAQELEHWGFDLVREADDYAVRVRCGEDLYVEVTPL